MVCSVASSTFQLNFFPCFFMPGFSLGSKTWPPYISRRNRGGLGRKRRTLDGRRGGYYLLIENAQGFMSVAGRGVLLNDRERKVNKSRRLSDNPRYSHELNKTTVSGTHFFNMRGPLPYFIAIPPPAVPLGVQSVRSCIGTAVPEIPAPSGIPTLPESTKEGCSAIFIYI